jgi:N-acetylmuramoyl-L-alanine amidase
MDRIIQASYANSMIIGIDPGHGGDNIGTHHYGIVEENYVLELGLRLRQILGELGMGAEITRNCDQAVSFEERASRLVHCDFILVLHCNAAQDAAAKELRTYVCDTNPIAVSAAREIERCAPEFIAPAKPSPVRVTAAADTVRCYNTLIKHMPRPAVLVELFFATHELSARWAQTQYGKASLLTCLAAGAINAWYNAEVCHTRDNPQQTPAAITAKISV